MQVQKNVYLTRFKVEKITLYDREVTRLRAKPSVCFLNEISLKEI